MDKRIASLIFATLILACPGASDHSQAAMVDKLYVKSSITRKRMLDCVQRKLKPDDAVLFFEFTIPFRRMTYCIGMATNVAVMGMASTGRVDFVKYKLDNEHRIPLFANTLRKYVSTSFSTSTGPRDLYVTVHESRKTRCCRFDYPSWVSHSHVSLPAGAFIGDDVRMAYEMMGTIFQHWILPRLSAFSEENSSYIIDADASSFDFDASIYVTRRMKCSANVQEIVTEAERLLIEIYGRSVIEERPWRVTDTNGCYLICGTLPEDMFGGVAQLKVRKNDGFAWVYYHGE